MNSIRLFALAAVMMTSMQYCAPGPPAEESKPSLSEEERRLLQRKCDIALSNAWEYYKNRDWNSSIRNYHTLVAAGCSEDYANDVFVYFGRAYLEIGKADSAIWAFQQGLKYLPTNKALLQNVAYAAGRVGNVDVQVRYMERWIEVDSTNGQAYSDLADLLRTEERWDDLLFLIKEWIKVDPTNSRIQSELIEVTELSGGDPLEVYKSRWVDDPDNPQYGMDYAAKLIEADRNTDAYRELEAVISSSPSSTRAYELLASAAIEAGDNTRGINAYERLYNLNRTNFKVAINLSKTYLGDSDYESAMQWAERALIASNKNGEAYYARAEVYYAVADECAGGRENGVARFDDKVVYLMAFEDYTEAANKAYSRGQSRADFLGKNLVPTKGDWFLQSADIRVFKPQGTCYTWITRTVRRP